MWRGHGPRHFSLPSGDRRVLRSTDGELAATLPLCPQRNDDGGGDQAEQWSQLSRSGGR